MPNKDPDATTPEPIPSTPVAVERSLPPPSLVTATGEHPAVVFAPAPTWHVLTGLALDVTAILCLTVLIALDKISASEGLPWMALLVGVKGVSTIRNRQSHGGGAVMSILGIGLKP